MADYLHWLDIATYALMAATGYFLFVRETETPYVTFRTRFLGGLISGLCLVCWMTSVLLPVLFSPRIAITGKVIGFHQVEDGDGRAHFEFRIAQRLHATSVLRANYFDRGFYANDPSISDGDAVAAIWLDWTNEITEIKVIEGRHAGWSYKQTQKVLFPSLAFLAGVILVLRAIGGAIRHSTTKQLDPPQDPKAARPGSILGI